MNSTGSSGIISTVILLRRLLLDGVITIDRTVILVL